MTLFETGWNAIGERLESWNPSSESFELLTTSDITAEPNDSLPDHIDYSRRYLLFRNAYDSVTIAFQDLQDAVSKHVISEGDAGMLLSYFKNNLADATERLDQWEDEIRLSRKK